MTTLLAGMPKVFIGTDKGEHSPEQLADMMIMKLIQVNGNAPKPIMDQVVAFQERAKTLFVQYLKEAQAIEQRKFMKHYGGLIASHQAKR